MNTSKHQSATTPSVIQKKNSYMDATETSNQHIETTELYITVGDTDIVACLCIITDDLFKTMGATVDIGYVDTIKTSNVNITVRESDVAL